MTSSIVILKEKGLWHDQFNTKLWGVDRITIATQFSSEVKSLGVNLYVRTYLDNQH